MSRVSREIIAVLLTAGSGGLQGQDIQVCQLIETQRAQANAAPAVEICPDQLISPDEDRGLRCGPHACLATMATLQGSQKKANGLPSKSP